MVVDKEYFQKLSGWQICRLWPRLSSDILLYHAAIEQFRKPKRILEVSGENAIEKVDRLKGNVRYKYARNIVSNCIHAPINYQEYRTHIDAIRRRDEEFNIVFPTLPYNSYNNFSEDEIRKLAKFIVDMGLYTLIPYATAYYNVKLYIIF